MATRVTSPVLVGRAAERQLLVETAGRAAERGPTTILLGGDAGIGKSRLVADLNATLRDAGWRVLQGSCVRLSDLDGLPFAPIAEALRTLRRDVGGEVLDGLMDAATSELASLVPDLVASQDPAGAAGRPDWAQTRIFEGTLTLLGRLGEGAPVALVIEDLHWADQSTRDLVAFLARNLRRERVALVATYRTDELHRRHPLRPWLVELERAPGVVRVDLEPLGAGAIREQVRAILDAEPSPETLEAIVRRSGGNPFFAEELLAAGATDDDLLPGTLRELLLLRVQALSDVTQEVLGVGAVGGVAFDHDLLLEVTDLDERTVAAGLREALAAQLLLVGDDASTYTFRHALLQEAVYDDLLPRERRRYHARYAAALRARPVLDGALGASQLAALADHATAAHELPLALQGWIDAARASGRVYALAESAHAYERALDLWDAVPPDDRPADTEIVDLFHEATMALVGIGQLRRARELSKQAVERFPVEDDPLKAAMLRERYARTMWLTSDLTEALAVLDEAVELTRGRQTEESARVLASLAGLHVLQDHTALAIELGREAVEQARAVGSPAIEAYAICGLGVALVNRGDCDEGLALLRRGVVMVHEERLSAIDMHRAYANLSTGLQICGDIEGAINVALEGVEWARGRGLWRLQGAFLEGNAAQALTEIGRWSEAMALLHQRDRPVIEGVAQLNHALVSGPLLARTGDTAAAAEVFAKAYEQLTGLDDAQFTGPILSGMAELALIDGRLDDVDRWVADGLARLARSEHTGTRYRAELLAIGLAADARTIAAAKADRDEARAKDRREVAADRIAMVHDLLQEELGPADGWGAEIRSFALEAEAEWTGIDRGPDPTAWAAAADAWTRLWRPYPTARCRERQAEAILESGGSRVDASAPLSEAIALAREIGAAPLLARGETLARLGRVEVAPMTEPGEAAALRETDGVGGPTDGADAAEPAPFGLTPRELDVLQLLVQGYSNRQIGETLYVSESTAGVHVSNILGKLGASNRVEAAAVAVRAGIGT